MRYKNGRLAKLGDTVVVENPNGKTIGTVIGISNSLRVATHPIPSVNPSLCTHTEDAFVKPKITQSSDSSD